jgi:hypothetical protein
MGVLADRTSSTLLSVTVSAVRAELSAIEPAGRGGGLPLFFVKQRRWLLEISIQTVFSIPMLEGMAGEIERRIYEKIATLSQFEAEQLAGSNLFAGT